MGAAPRSISDILNYLLIISGCYILFLFLSPEPVPLTSQQQSTKPTSHVELSNELQYLREEKVIAETALAEAKALRESFNLRKGQKIAPEVELPNPQRNLPPQTNPVPTEAPANPTTPVSASHLNYLRSNLLDPDAPRPKVTILLYNKFEGYLDWWRDNDEFQKIARRECSTECIFTSDRGKLSEADGVAFHVKTHRKGDFPQRKDGQKFIMISLEQPLYAPLMNDASYVSSFDMTATYDLQSTIPTIAIHPHYSSSDFRSATALSFQEKDGFGEPNAIAAFVSNCHNAGASERLKQMEELRKHMPLHSYGACLKNKDEPKLSDNRSENKRLVLQRYKFYLSFENSDIKDYVSEKVFDGLLAGTLPVYRGAESIDKFLPSPTNPSVVKMSDFGSDMKKLADYLLFLAEDEEKYNEYFTWKEEDDVNGRFQSIIDMTAYKYTSMCRICKAVYDAK